MVRSEKQASPPESPPLFVSVAREWSTVKPGKFYIKSRVIEEIHTLLCAYQEKHEIYFATSVKFPNLRYSRKLFITTLCSNPIS